MLIKITFFKSTKLGLSLNVIDDKKIAKKISNILAGGNLSQSTLVSEQYLLDLEREAFLSLCGERKTLERIQFMLKNGKPLRN